MDMGLIGVICGIAGARIYYIIFSWDMYKDNLLSVFNLREGGLAIYGGIIGAILSVLVCAKVKRLSAPQILDTVAMALVDRCWDGGGISSTGRCSGDIRTPCLPCGCRWMRCAAGM